MIGYLPDDSSLLSFGSLGPYWASSIVLSSFRLGFA